MTTTSSPAYPGVTIFLPDEVKHRRMLANGINSQLIGKMNVTLDVTIAQGVSMTTVTDARIGFSTAIIPTATSYNGALLINAGIYNDAPLSGSVVLHHSAWALSNMNLRLVLIG